jgi:twin BRCT domain/BRCA1 C Terminus (BRCT) domain
LSLKCGLSVASRLIQHSILLISPCANPCLGLSRGLVYYPFIHQIIVDLNNIAISITGFSGPDLLHIERLITLLGAQYFNNLTRKRSLLLTPDRNVKGQKTIKAKDWGIPVVSLGWLWEVISRGSDEVEIGPWSERPAGSSPAKKKSLMVAELKKFTPEEGSGSLKLTSGNIASCPSAMGQAGSILDSCVIFVSKKLEDQVSELHSIAKQLGAEIAEKFDQTLVTHLIHQSSRNAETFREFRVARSENIHIVHPQWIYECRARGMRCGEDAWGWMWNADKSLTVIGTAEPNSAPAAPTESRREKRMRQDENVPPHRPVNEPVKIEQITKLLGNISSPQKKAKRRLAGRARNLQHSNTASSVTSPENESTKSHEEEHEVPRPTQDRVEYKDPVAEREMAKIVANLRGTAEPEGEGERLVSHEMTPAEDVGTRSSRRKSSEVMDFLA